MSIRPNSLYIVFFATFLFLTMSLCSECLHAQNGFDIKAISINDFEKMEMAEKRVHFLQWNNFSSQSEIPIEVEQKALEFYKKRNLDERIYQKYKALFRIITNGRLPLLNRINAGNFIVATYDETIIPIDLFKDILLELAQQTK